jgi:hypothetical protein
MFGLISMFRSGLEKHRGQDNQGGISAKHSQTGGICRIPQSGRGISLLFQGILRDKGNTENGEIREAMEMLDKAEEMCPDSPYGPYFKGCCKKQPPAVGGRSDINSLFASAALKSTGKNAALLPE